VTLEGVAVVTSS